MLNDLSFVSLCKQTRDWESALLSWLTELSGYVKRAEARERLSAYLRGLLGEVERVTVGSWRNIRATPPAASST